MRRPSLSLESKLRWEEGVFRPQDDAFVKDLARVLEGREERIGDVTVRVRLREIRPEAVEQGRVPTLSSVVALFGLEPPSGPSTPMTDVLTGARLTYSFTPTQRIEKQLGGFEQHLR